MQVRELAELPADSVLVAPITSYGPDCTFASVDCRYAGELHDDTLWVMDPRSATNSLLHIHTEAVAECLIITYISINPGTPQRP